MREKNKEWRKAEKKIEGKMKVHMRRWIERTNIKGKKQEGLEGRREKKRERGKER